MIVPVQPRSVVPEGSSPIGQSGREHVGSLVPADAQTPSVHIDRLVVESSAPISAASIREGFREAWLHHDRPARWTADAFRGDLTIDLPAGVTGRELGRRLAEAILQRAGSRG